ncbi:hypothetical protein RJ641_001265 [Dillenia turbinata]|uniref:Uncharacterized protein n=1 Tax=Dillenia turbinata TaxID=194707 RepID=A0AAN8ZS97_9MAGN
MFTGGQSLKRVCNEYKGIPNSNSMVSSVGKFVLKSIHRERQLCSVALNPQVKGVRGEYFSDCNIAKPSSMVNDAELARKLWDFSI